MKENMQVNPLKIGEIQARVPLIQGGMGIGISLGGLAGAVAKEGGVGIISAAQIGYREPDFNTNTKEANIRAIGKEYQKARAIAPDGIIGFNIMVAMEHYEDYVKAAAKTGADIIISGAGVPTKLPEAAAGYRTKLAPIVSTAKSARVILKYWDKKYKRIPDLMVIEGPCAGGHLGFGKKQLLEYFPNKKEFLQEAYDNEVKAILKEIRAYEEKYGRKIPMALAGGIWDRQQADHAFLLGADAIQVATRFVTTKECDADARYKETYLKAKKEDIIFVDSPVGMPGRAIRNPFMEKVAAGEKIPPHLCRRCLANCSPSEIPYCITEALINAAKGQVDDALLFCGSDAYRAERIETVKDVFASLIGEGRE